MATGIAFLDRMGPTERKVLMFGVPAVAVLAVVQMQRAKTEEPLPETGPELASTGAPNQWAPSTGLLDHGAIGGLADAIADSTEAILGRLDESLERREGAPDRPVSGEPAPAPAPAAPRQPLPGVGAAPVAPRGAEVVAGVPAAAEPKAVYRQPDKVLAAQAGAIDRADRRLAAGEISESTHRRLVGNAERRSAVAKSSKK